MNLNLRTKLALKIQHMIGWITFPAWGGVLIALMRFVARYRIPQLREIRRQYKEIKKSTTQPIVICSNHLTKIDSIIINWSFASVWSYMRSFKYFSWNLPERANFYRNIVLRVLCYLGSCIPVDRGGDREAVKKSLDKLAWLLKKGHTITIFPEGTRSRTGRINPEGVAYGVGRLVRAVENCKVVCVYLRSHSQDTYSGIPKRGSEFYLTMEAVEPKTEHSGLRATRDIAFQIIEKLKEMEQEYFDRLGQGSMENSYA
ncbi:MAG TPA: 1-acyl-sn-glycerol-3-phosphate acyltransferase [Bacteroidetes bacterium]|nr:1-acyl-sn-glycerol-3-phosphate acyltransferase [Bacteroidota bacterium]